MKSPTELSSDLQWCVSKPATVCLILLTVSCATLLAQEQPAARSTVDNISATNIAAAQQFGQTLSVADWLGPLAPVALSPFFGITCLSGMAIYGRNWVSQDNAFLGEASPLNDHMVFWIFLILTLITSLPRLTKVSKPFAQAVDQIEAWAGLITMITLKIMVGAGTPELGEMAAIHLGLVSVTTDTLLVIAAAINVFVINTVKFFFEVLIWITPIPAIDAIFEFSNKAVCAVLMAIYGYSPTIATGINLAMFLFAALIFSWVYRREIFFRTMLLDAVRAWLFPKNIKRPELIVFPVAPLGPFAARTRCRLCKTETGWTLTQQRLLRSDVMIELLENESSIELQTGFFTNSLRFSGKHPCELTFSRCYNNCLTELAISIGAKLDEQPNDKLADRAALKSEMA